MRGFMICDSHLLVFTSYLTHPKAYLIALRGHLLVFKSYLAHPKAYLIALRGQFDRF